MREVEDTVDTAEVVIQFGLGALDDLLDDAIDTAYGRDDPDFVTDADLTIGTHVTLEGELLGWLLAGEALETDIAVVERAGKVGLDILMIEVRTLADSVTCMTDGESVFDDVFALCKIAKGTLMTGRNIGDECNFVTFNIDDSTLAQWLDSDNDIIGGIDFEELLHRIVGFDGWIK